MHREEESTFRLSLSCLPSFSLAHRVIDMARFVAFAVGMIRPFMDLENLVDRLRGEAVWKLARWEAKDELAASAEGDAVELTRRAEGNLLRQLSVFIERDIAYVHDEVVKRLRRKKYKDGWRIKFKVRFYPEVWAAVLLECQTAGASIFCSISACTSFLSPPPPHTHTHTRTRALACARTHIDLNFASLN